jgi:hypothetical protein
MGLRPMEPGPPLLAFLETLHGSAQGFSSCQAGRTIPPPLRASAAPTLSPRGITPGCHPCPHLFRQSPDNPQVHPQVALPQRRYIPQRKPGTTHGRDATIGRIRPSNSDQHGQNWSENGQNFAKILSVPWSILTVTTGGSARAQWGGAAVTRTVHHIPQEATS